jgi:hypothetical protein
MPKDLNEPAGANPPSRYFEPPTEPEFSWPPSAEDLEACAIVHFDGDDAGRMLPLALELEPGSDIETPVHPPVAVPVRAKVRLRRRFPRSAASIDVPMVEETDGPGSARAAVLSVLVAAACVVIAYTQFRLEWRRGETLPAVVLKSAAAPEPERAPIPEPTMDPIPAGSAALSVAAARTRPADPRREPAPVPSPSTEAADAVPSITQAVPVAAGLPATLVAGYVAAPRFEPPRPEPARIEPTRVEPTRPEPMRPEPAVVKPEPVAARVASAPIVDEEDGIRSTLTRWRTAYSQLDAGAAQQVWPSVDVRALRTAFKGIKSQELHFDRCELTVAGARAQAACSGRAVYVPGVGDRSPRTTMREWNFELQKADERWTIASARSS